MKNQSQYGDSRPLTEVSRKIGLVWAQWLKTPSSTTLMPLSCAAFMSERRASSPPKCSSTLK